MKIIISNKIYISDYSPDLIEPIKKALTINNPQYQMAIAMARKDSSKRGMIYAMKKEFKYYEEKDGEFIISRGNKQRLLRYLKVRGIKYDLEENYSNNKMESPLPENISLRNYQIGDDEKILNCTNGILKLGTGYGKTIIALKLAEKTKLKTLIICCKSESSEVSKYKTDFKNIYKKDIGVMQGKVYNIKDVTVCTVSTLIRLDLDNIANKFGMIIVDECHASLSEKRQKAIERFNPKYFYGMSGTPGRANGQGEAVNFFYGSIIIDKKLPQDEPAVHVYKTHAEVGASEYYEMEENVCEHEERNELIVENIYKYALEGRKILVLTKRIEHGKKLLEKINSHSDNPIKCLALSSKDSSSMRNELIQALRSEEEEFQILIGTYSLFSTGIDIPLLDTVFLAMSIKVDGDYDATLIQSVGRILRLHNEKLKPTIIDFDDNLNKIMHRHHLSRMRVYKENGWSVLNIN